jgi:hypothetical protein
MTKIVINTCHGGFGISAAAESKYRELAGITDPDFHSRLIPRDDEHLIAVVELMGRAADGGYAELKIIEIPDGVNWYVEEYDGRERVAERRRTWS